ncbi:MAG: Nup133 N terminal like-domain-containing protein, partial [Olpidium bornovanus]
MVAQAWNFAHGSPDAGASPRAPDSSPSILAASARKRATNQQARMRASGGSPFDQPKHHHHHDQPPPQQQQQQNRQQKPPVEQSGGLVALELPTLEMLKHGAHQVAKQLNHDDQFPDLEELVEASGHNVTGQYTPLPDKQAWETSVAKHNIVFPDALFEQLDSGVSWACFRKLIEPGSQRTTGFTYGITNDFHTYDECDETIIGVALVKPRSDVFNATVQHVLVLSTPLEIHLLGLSLSSSESAGGQISNVDQPASELTLYVTQITAPTDSTNMTCIVGTRTGRIFMCGADGRLWELIYRAEEGWFTPRCRLEPKTGDTSFLLPKFLAPKMKEIIGDIAYDGSRNILYTVSDHSTIDVFNLGS